MQGVPNSLPDQGSVFPKKNARFSKMKNITDLLTDDKEGYIIWNIDFWYFSNRASFVEILYVNYNSFYGKD